ncbi:MAG: hypothetical protein CMJ32_03330 [Phycisphaerae bacterium]|nr:hypothetical protein [Phycisphaerae bacterium]
MVLEAVRASKTSTRNDDGLLEELASGQLGRRVARIATIASVMHRHQAALGQPEHDLHGEEQEIQA